MTNINNTQASLKLLSKNLCKSTEQDNSKFKDKSPSNINLYVPKNNSWLLYIQKLKVTLYPF